MEPFVLKDKEQFPTPEVLGTILEDSFPAYEQLEKIEISTASFPPICNKPLCEISQRGCSFVPLSIN